MAVVPVIEISPQGPGVTLAAHVRTDERRPLAWRLTVESGSPHNQSRVAQTGQADGSDRHPVAIVGVNSPGDAKLQIYDPEGRLIAETRRIFAAGADPSGASE